MRIGVFGSGYVGIVSAVCLAELGNHVHCVDVDAAKIEMLRRAECPIYEPALLPMLKENLEAGRIVFSTNAIEAIE
ncbi:MAG: UDP-glucose 6-dehydrogenase, partial [Gammaproteobacteria bacterium]|nr:UDP-glucose 6-dehydrogenase [Gammaproteobacteria bacterium]